MAKFRKIEFFEKITELPLKKGLQQYQSVGQILSATVTFRGPSRYGEKITYSASLTPVLHRYDLPFLSLCDLETDGFR